MINAILTRIVGTRNERELKRIRPVVAQIGAFEPALRELSDQAHNPIEYIIDEYRSFG